MKKKKVKVFTRTIIWISIIFSLYNLIFVVGGNPSYFGKGASMLILSPLIVLFLSIGFGYYSFFAALILFPILVFLILKVASYVVKRFKWKK